ncbi:MAG: heme-binding protein [Methyloglobulus sp.]|nr:heme-binding protein [Methyloglobulus sp.]
MKKVIKITCALATVLLCISASAFGQNKKCAGLPDHAALHDALANAQKLNNGGLGLHMWASVVNRDGFVCAVAFSGNDRNSQWPGSRVIAAQKAYTANAFSLDALALSTANLYSLTQPGGSLYGLQHSNPVATDPAYQGNPLRYGTDKDPMAGKKVGGINVFGGGLGLYDGNGKIIGALGVSGDTSCADHNIAWRTRFMLALDNVTKGVGTPDDNIIFDIGSAKPSGFGHPTCNDISISTNQAVIAHPDK